MKLRSPTLVDRWKKKFKGGQAEHRKGWAFKTRELLRKVSIG